MQLTSQKELNYYSPILPLFSSSEKEKGKFGPVPSFSVSIPLTFLAISLLKGGLPFYEPLSVSISIADFLNSNFYLLALISSSLLIAPIALLANLPALPALIRPGIA